MGLKTVKFISRAGKYATGDVASFPPDNADVYINAGKAMAYNLEAAGNQESADDKPKSKPAKVDDDGDKKTKRRVRQMEAGRGGDYETKDS